MINAYSFILISGWLIIVLSTSYFCNKLFPEEKELSRKIVHMGSGPIIPLAYWLNISAQIAIPIASVITLALLINYRFKLLTSIENIERKSFGTIAYGISITLLLILFWTDNPSAVISGVLVMAFGDGLAGFIGRKVKSPQWILFGQRKSLIGTLTMGFVSALILTIVNQSTAMQLGPIAILSITSIAVALEQVSTLGIDNITVPIGVALSWQIMSFR
ncbi:MULTISPECIES: diacylglycerol/polyprenol kinase family protein [Prochlorococcus]|uniref:Dolichol kinase n=1 Tax=Prochlorococcus marinus (strain SARG / CCMP1375 / SS120) TaxID=167539 RepID=Q7V9G9_PROMA|nr:Dolichol kinase [Prochlorococcus marinus subsp. marinus str. CCMP1375]KGG19937.1 phytol kinase [Prochlorococcus marinus str. SS2]KGG23843.1 phytol kinase [Prochlorococcus marinus str. SS35]KGG31897.1 phytol kinase [Prochlorococcus marinus str. SS51]